MIKFLLMVFILLWGTITVSAQSTFNSNIHNTCGWEPSTTYTYHAGPPNGHFTRVNNGLGWTPSGTCTDPTNGGMYTPGSALNSYQLLDPGSAHTCVSAASGGPSGTGSSIPDGGCTWKYLSGVDNISLTGWALDNGVIWSTGTTYGVYNVVQVPVVNLPVYQLVTAGCVSTVQPTGTDLINPFTTADNCTWLYLGSIYYSSHSHPVPMQLSASGTGFDTFQGSISGTSLTVTVPPSSVPLQSGNGLIIAAPGVPAFTYLASGSGTSWTLSSSASSPFTGTIFDANWANNVTLQINDLYYGQLWNDNEYVSGTNGENSPIKIWNHKSLYDDGIQSFIISSPANTASLWGFPLTIEPALGEGVADTFAANPSLALAGYNANNGVAIRGVGVNGLVLLDTALTIHGLQVTSNTTEAIDAFSDHGCVICVYDHNIFEGGVGSPDVVNSEMTVMYDNLIIAHGAGGALFDYGGRSYNNTIVCPTADCTGAAIQNTWNWTTPYGVTISGNAIFGFAHVIANSATAQVGDNCLPPGGSATCATWQGTNNATDVSATDGNNYPAISYLGYNGGVLSYPQNFATGQAYCAHNEDGQGNTPFPSTCDIQTSLSPSSVFVSWPGNYKISPSSPLYGAGASLGSFASCGVYNPSSSFPPPKFTWSGCTVTADTPDLLGTARPQASSRFDTGAFELPTSTGTGPRLFFR